MFPCVAFELLYCISLNKRCGVSHPYSGFVSWGLLGIKINSKTAVGHTDVVYICIYMLS